MKNLISLSLLVFILVSCGKKKDAGFTETASIPESTRSNLEVSSENTIHGHCKKAPTTLESLKLKSEDELDEFLKDNNVEFVTAISHAHQVQFAYELKRFPEGILKYIADKNINIRIMEGRGVGEDPTFPNYNSTDDGRLWKTVPGSGGASTRLVVNRLYDGHGSFNLTLHEHAHTFDLNGVEEGSLSEQKEWKEVMAKDTNLIKVLQKYCGNYCTKNPREAFAETIAIYFGCEGSRLLLSQSPLALQYLQKLEVL